MRERFITAGSRHGRWDGSPPRTTQARSQPGDASRALRGPFESPTGHLANAIRQTAMQAGRQAARQPGRHGAAGCTGKQEGKQAETLLSQARHFVLFGMSPRVRKST